jgi:hypothetical protein
LNKRKNANKRAGEAIESCLALEALGSIHSTAKKKKN